VKFYRAWEEKQRLYIQTELCKMSLSAYAEQHHNIPEPVIWKFLVDLLKALKHLHERQLVHMDIKPENIFISYDGVCKLGDFGLMIDLKKVSLKLLVKNLISIYKRKRFQSNQIFSISRLI
jgi:membrane-associated tyrosine- and threonine-specific cdc2-inhibitory kinase